MSGELLMIPNSEKMKEKNKHLADSLHLIPVPQPAVPDPTPTPPPPPTYPDEIGPFTAYPITFDGGIPVGGSMTLAVFKDGSYAFSGHFHDSGAPSYDVEGRVIVSTSGRAFTFEAKGSTHGTFEAGSRNFDFSQNGHNDTIRDAWPELCAGYHWRWSAYVNWNLQTAVDDVVSALKTAGTVIGAVVAVVAIIA
jgi:hypothetical protein